MNAAAFGRPIAKLFDRVLDALFDPRRCDRAMLLLLAGYAATWTLYGSIARSSQDLHPDMAELIAWSRDLSLGYAKHPPLGAWLVRLWFSIFPLADWSYYLLAMLMPTIAMWIVWRFSADYLELRKRVVAVVLLAFIPFYNFHALKFNANTVLLPVWPAATFFFLRSYKSRDPLNSVLAGVSAAACMLGKYWSIVLLAGLALAALLDSRRWDYLRSSAPWLTIAAGFAVLGPHLFWLYQHDFAPVEYAVAKHVTHSFAGAAAEVFGYVAALLAYATVPIILILAMARPGRATIADMAWPIDSARRLVATSFFAPLLLPIVAGPAMGLDLTSLWSMPAWSLLPIVLLSSPALSLQAIDTRRVLALSAAIPLVMVIAAPVIAVVIHRLGVTPPAAHGRLLAAETERAWHDVTADPLRFVGCDVAEEVIAYAPDRPRALPWRSFHGDIADKMYAAFRGWPEPQNRWAETSDNELSQSGMALVCLNDDSIWLRAAADAAARDPASRRVDIEITRDFLGIRGQPQRYVIFVIPPHHAPSP